LRTCAAASLSHWDRHAALKHRQQCSSCDAAERLIPQFHDPHTAWLMLAMSSTLAGNLTISGSVANIIVVEKARTETHIGFFEYMKVGLSVTILRLATSGLWLILVHH